jgi:hypothetical protein
MVRVLLSLALAVLVVLSLAAPTGAQPVPPARETAQVPVTLVLESAEASDASGFVTLQGDADRSEGLLLTLTMEGLAPGAEYVAHLHAGTPDAPSASFGLLGTFHGDAEGRGSLETSSLSMSAAGDVLDLSLDVLTDGEHLIDVHTAEGESVAVAAIPYTEPAPSQ